jgi:2-methylisocitrate lyase-like PEP mutase family enzyme
VTNGDARDDALFVEAPRSVEELARIGQALPKPLVADMLEGGVTPLLPKTELDRLGFHLIVCPLTGLYAAAKALGEMFALIQRAGTTQSALDRLLTFPEFHKLIGLDAFYACDERYRVPDEQAT